ncbi:MAG: hypothetical protein ACHQ51_04595 [Elusimicrobiota bacterium]
MRTWILPACLLLTAAPARSAPMRRLGGGGDGRPVACRQTQEYPGMRCGAVPDASDSFVVPQALWGGAVESSSCSEAARAALMSRLESEASLFNTGVLRARSGIGLQLFAQDGGGCEAAASAWGMYIDVQRELFVTRWQDVVRAALEQCPLSDKPASSPKKSGARRAVAMCRDGGGDPAPAGCRPVPEVQEDSSLASDMTSAEVQSCPRGVQMRTNALVFSRAANFKASQALWHVAGEYFLAGLAGARCDDSLTADAMHVQKQREVFVSVSVGATAQAGAACHEAGNSGLR